MSILTQIPHNIHRAAPVTDARPGYLEIRFNRELTEDEQERFNAEFMFVHGEYVAAQIDWRDPYTVWIWNLPEGYLD